MVTAPLRLPPSDLVVARPEGLYCPPGDFYIDPWRPVDRAVITHAHSRPCARRPQPLPGAAPTAQARCARGWAATSTLQTLPYGEAIEHHGVRVSLHPAGHVLGSAQVRLEHGGEVWVVSGDYKTRARRHLRAVRAGALRHLHHRIDLRPADLPLADAGRAVRRDQRLVARAMPSRAARRVLFCYAFGKAQRILHGVDAVDRADRGARRGRAAERGLPRGRRGAAADRCA